MQFEVLIPSLLTSSSKLAGILKSLDKQSLLPYKIWIGIDKNLNKEDYDLLNYQIFKSVKNMEVRDRINVLTNFNSDFFYGRGVSRNRNYLMDKVKSPYLYFIDDDNEFQSDFFEKTISLYQKYNNDLKKDFVFSPKIIYRKTSVSQSEGIKDFNFFLSKVVLNKIGDKNYSVVKMIGGNSLFGKTEIFQKIRFDESFEFAYEDLDFSYRCYLGGFPIVVSNELGINHMERDKTVLEHSFIGSEKNAYRKSRNRIVFTKKNATSFQRFAFFGLGLRIQTLRFFVLILFFGSSKLDLFKAVISGTKDGLKS